VTLAPVGGREGMDRFAVRGGDTDFLNYGLSGVSLWTALVDCIFVTTWLLSFYH